LPPTATSSCASPPPSKGKRRTRRRHQPDHAHPSYPLLRAGNSYIGLASLFGKQYITQYDPIKDGNGKVIGVLFIGIDITKNLAMLKEKIKAIKVGDRLRLCGERRQGNYGNALVHPSMEGRICST
jgi:methyl-accepting chemotaxis protein-2 (aspartate sensor receptor)